MGVKDDVLTLVHGFEAVVQDLYPAFEECDAKTFQRRLDITMRASAALMSAGCAAYIRFYGPEEGEKMFGLLQGTIQHLTQLNLQAQPGEESSEAFHKGKLH